MSRFLYFLLGFALAVGLSTIHATEIGFGTLGASASVSHDFGPTYIEAQINGMRYDFNYTEQGDKSSAKLYLLTYGLIAGKHFEKWDVEAGAYYNNNHADIVTHDPMLTVHQSVRFNRISPYAGINYNWGHAVFHAGVLYEGRPRVTAFIPVAYGKILAEQTTAHRFRYMKWLPDISVRYHF